MMKPRKKTDKTGFQLWSGTRWLELPDGDRLSVWEIAGVVLLGALVGSIFWASVFGICFAG